MHISKRDFTLGVASGVLLPLVSGFPAFASTTAVMQSIAEFSSKDKAIAGFYKSIGYKQIWTGKRRQDRARREAFLKAIAAAATHGLPAEKYQADALKSKLRSVSSQRELGKLDVELSRMFLDYARDVQTGILNPRRIDEEMPREVPLRSRQSILSAFEKSNAAGFIKSLPPKAPEYARLMKEKLRFEKIVARGGWGGKVSAKKLEPGASGNAVIQLRNRLIAMGYLKRTSTKVFNEKMVKAVAEFQQDHGLNTDGVVGPRTLAAINTQAETRLSQIIVAMERERWLNMPLGKRHVWVNLTDFHARIIDNGKITFKTRSVVGMNADDRRSPEFSDVMEYMVINPTWNVPESITIKEYLPMLREDPYAVSHLNLLDKTSDQVVPRTGLDFNDFDEENFPFRLKEPPSQGNALGLVKFMFPNRHNIYLHDTPAKSLFGREKRDFSHGCIRLRDPFDFAYALLARQTNDPKGFFARLLRTGEESFVNLKEPVPVHLVYRTAFTEPKRKIQFRGDVYRRDSKIWRALENAGVALGSVRG
ncbi:MAG: L,D-transpeptidase family protein [Boseongicola sp.]|nr:MAG: L,D-transpeptidase family protein [Boseongicola sp.]